MTKLRLLERLANLDLEELDSNQIKLKQTVKESVINHIQRLLNTRPGTALVDENFGLVGEATQIIGSRVPDPHNMAKQMLSQINAYEPRLSECRVDVDLNNNHEVGVNLIISGNVVGDNSGERLLVTGMLLANGSLKFDLNT